MRMHLPRYFVAFLFLLCTGLANVRGDGAEDVVKQQKELASANWKRAFEKEEFVHVETPNFLIYGYLAIDAKVLKATGETLDSELALAKKALGLEDKKPLWPGKVTMYLIENRRQLRSFTLAVEKRRLDTDELGSVFFKNDIFHVAACGPTNKQDPILENQAAEQFLTLVMNRFAGDNNGIPFWIRQGFAQALVWRSATTDAAKKQRDGDRKKLLALVNSRKPPSIKDLVGEGAGADFDLARASMVEYLAFGPTADKFAEFLKSFKLEEGQTKSLDDALSTMKLFPDKLDRLWAAWVRAGSK